VMLQYFPSPITPTDTEAYENLIKAIREVHSDIIISPFLLTGGTDARKYYELCENIFRFIPIRINKELMGTIHSDNERIKVEDFTNMIDFYISFIENYLE
ncbi:MAG: M20/M25/M40 family metallo-hydrolase, partial [Tissierellia bacterium]|nr:M20/M25/M40 family metallo-hydrolase [Tissierellia bacterium]